MIMCGTCVFFILFGYKKPICRTNDTAKKNTKYKFVCDFWLHNSIWRNTQYKWISFIIGFQTISTQSPLTYYNIGLSFPSCFVFITVTCREDINCIKFQRTKRLIKWHIKNKRKRKTASVLLVYQLKYLLLHYANSLEYVCFYVNLDRQNRLLYVIVP